MMNSGEKGKGGTGLQSESYYEEALRQLMIPRNPDPHFVSRLKSRLTNPNHIELDKPTNGLEVFFKVCLVIGSIAVLLTLIWGRSNKEQGT